MWPTEYHVLYCLHQHLPHLTSLQLQTYLTSNRDFKIKLIAYVDGSIQTAVLQYYFLTNTVEIISSNRKIQTVLIILP